MRACTFVAPLALLSLFFAAVPGCGETTPAPVPPGPPQHADVPAPPASAAPTARPLPDFQNPGGMWMPHQMPDRRAQIGAGAQTQQARGGGIEPLDVTLGVEHDGAVGQRGGGVAEGLQRVQQAPSHRAIAGLAASDQLGDDAPGAEIG